MKYYDTESGKYLDEAELRQEFIVLKRKRETDAENFGQYVNNCCSKNGTLMEIPKADAEIVSVDSYYYTEGKYGLVSHKGKSYHAYIFCLKSTVSNGNEIDWNGVNSVILDETENRIFQTSGYTKERGLFCDLY